MYVIVKDWRKKLRSEHIIQLGRRDEFTDYLKSYKIRDLTGVLLGSTYRIKKRTEGTESFTV